MIIKIIFLCLSSIFVLSALWNFSYALITFIATNLSVRESFYFSNDLSKKGTHSGGDNYILKTRGNKYSLISLNFMKIVETFSDVSDIDPLESNFAKEFQLLSLLKELGKHPNDFKRETALYVPKTLSTYWDISCDSHFAPFVAPAITNMAMIEGLPIRDQKTSCYTHFDDYGYMTYRIRGIKAEWMEMDYQIICQKAIQKGFQRIIEINKNDLGDIISIFHECGG